MVRFNINLKNSEELQRIKERKTSPVEDLDAPTSKKGNNNWSEEEVINVFMCYKQYGTKWSKFVHEFPGRNESNLKNKFYSILKRVATQAQLENPKEYKETLIKSKRNLVQFVDLAMKYWQQIPSKRGRKRNVDRILAPSKPILFSPKNPNAEVNEEVKGDLPSFLEFIAEYTTPIERRSEVEFNSDGLSQVFLIGIFRALVSFCLKKRKLKSTYSN